MRRKKQLDYHFETLLREKAVDTICRACDDLVDELKDLAQPNFKTPEAMVIWLEIDERNYETR